MSLSREEHEWFQRREQLNEDEADVVDMVLKMMRPNVMLIPLAKDDRAARFEAALVRYIIESRE